MEPAITKHPRVDAADVLRGMAVLGIVLLHSIEHFNFYSFPDPATQSTLLNFADKSIWNSLFFLFGGKAYAIFAMLFGFSFFIQEDNQRMRGRDFRARFAWRLVLLFVIGNINALFFTGEVLVMLSLVGVVLILVCRMPTRWLLVLAGVLLLQPVHLWYVLRTATDSAFVTPAIQSGPWWAACYEQQTSGTLAGMMAVNMWEGQLASLAWAWDHGRICQTAALYIIGMLIGRQGWFMADKLRYWGRVMIVALFSFFALHGLDPMLADYITNPNVLKPLRVVVTSLSNFMFMLVLVSVILYCYYRTRARGLLSRIIPYGKMSMTNYVTQSIIGSFLFYHWGLHLPYGSTISVCIGVAVFLVQYAFCKWWLRERSHGPLEYVWKRLTWI